jgi:hypothetical protein
MNKFLLKAQMFATVLILVSSCTTNSTPEISKNPSIYLQSAEPPDYLIRTVDTAAHRYFRRITGNYNQTTTWLDDPTKIVTWGKRARHAYSKIQPWNANQTLLRLFNVDCAINVIGCNSNIFLDGYGWGDTYKIKFAKQRPNSGQYLNSEERWHPIDPDLVVYLDQINSSVEIGTWNVRTDAVTTIERFPNYEMPDLGDGEGNLSDDGKFIAIVARRKSDGKRVVFSFNLQTKQKYPDFDLSSVTIVDWASISPSGTYIVIHGCWDIVALCKPQEVNGVQVSGVSAERTLVIMRNGSPFPNTTDLYNIGWWGEKSRPSHYDLIQENGVDYAVGISYFRPTPNDGSEDGYPIKRRLSNAVVTQLTSNPTYRYPTHASTRNINFKSWAYFSYSGNLSSPGFVRAINLDGTGQVENLAQFPNACSDYWSQPQAVASPDGQRIIWASSWNSSDCKISTYVTER